ncbi:hypothetical protein PE067_14725 [Paracoccus sp. DMF-8]|uniref:hypothetical protein n=1 Tax=Paracoccus sp. DMF-8 TaxID=3019445 RepID=UPI0023E401DD|nr:hypothetical protein [Paracoccus sp. DMF-8]MDF3607271.1 hypothetical protein [Paracoccus sp. DMF-8]
MKALTGLEQVARLRSDIEMKKFSIFRAKVVAVQARLSQLQDQLRGYYDVPAAFSLDEARLTNALTVETLQSIAREEAHLQRMLPAFEMARAAATKEFGRVQVLRQLGEDLDHQRDLIARRRM